MKDITDACGNGNLHANNGNLKVESQEEESKINEDEAAIYELNKKIKNIENGSTKSTDWKTKDTHNDKSVKVIIPMEYFYVIRTLFEL